MATPRKANPQKAGRKSEYLPLYATQVKNLCLLNQGIIDEDIARFFEKNVSCISKWKVDHPEFKEAIRAGKASANTDIAAALYKRAKGGVYLRQKEIKLKRAEFDDKGKKTKEWEEFKIIDLFEDVPPDTQAGMYFLNNRDKMNWQARNVLSGPDGGPIPVGTVGLDELLKEMTK